MWQILRKFKVMGPPVGPGCISEIDETTYKTFLWIDAIFVSVDSDWPHKRQVVMLKQQLMLLLLVLLVM